MQFEWMSARQRVVVTLAGMAVIGLGLIGATHAEEKQKSAGNPSAQSAGSTSSNLTIIDATPINQSWPRYHIVYNSAKNTATYVEISDDKIEIRSIVPLDKVTPRQQ